MQRLIIGIAAVLGLAGLITADHLVATWTANRTSLNDNDIFLFQYSDGALGEQDAYITYGNIKQDLQGDLAFLPSSHDVAGVTTSDIANWSEAFGWGNHAEAGYLTSYTESQTALTVPFTPTGTIAATTVQEAIAEVASEAGSGVAIDDTAGDGDTTVVWSADKAQEVADSKQDTITTQAVSTDVATFMESADKAAMQQNLDLEPGVDVQEVMASSDVTSLFSGTGDYLKADGTTGTPTVGSFDFDTFPAYEDSAHSSGLAYNSTHLAFWNGSKWLTIAGVDTLDLTPTAGTLVCSPTSWDPVDGTEGDSSVSQTFTCTATGGPVNMSDAISGLADNYFTDLGTGTCTDTTELAEDGSCTINLQFAYTTAGTYSDTLVITSDATDSPENIALGPVTVNAVASSELSLVGSASDDAASGTAVSITHGLTINSGDLVLATVQSNNNISIADNNGSYSFTEAVDTTLTGHTRAIYWRVAGASEPSSYNFTLSADNRWAIIVAVFRPGSGSIAASPFDVAPTTTTASSTTTATAPAITVLNDNSIAIASLYIDGTDGVSSFDTAGWTELATVTGQQGISMYYKSADSGSTGDAEWSFASGLNADTEQYSLKPGE